MMRFKRILKRMAMILIALVLAVLVVYGLLNYYWGRQIESQLAAIKAAGQPVSLADLQRHPVPDQDNAALIYDKIFKSMNEAIPLKITPGSKVVKMAEPASARDLELIRRTLFPAERKLTPTDWAKAKAALERCDRIFVLIKEAQSRRECQFPPCPVIKGTSQASQNKYTMASEEYLQRLAGLRDVTRLLCVKMLISAREGKTQDVVSYTYSALRVSDALAKNSSLIDYFVNHAIADTTLISVKQALDYCQPDEQELEQLDIAFSRIRLSELYKSAIEGERAHFLLQNYEFKKSGLTMPLFSNGDTLAYLDFVSRHLKCTHMNYSTALSKRLVGPKTADNLPFYACLTKITAPVTARAARARYEYEAEIACGRTFLALRAYKLRFGKYPQTLKELKSSIDWELPVDPFTGKNLIYKQTGNGFILYSVAYDLKDDGGTELKHQNNDEWKGDIVWKIAS